MQSQAFCLEFLYTLRAERISLTKPLDYSAFLSQFGAVRILFGKFQTPLRKHFFGPAP